MRCLISEPAAARLGALTTPGARADAVITTSAPAPSTSSARTARLDGKPGPQLLIVGGPAGDDELLGVQLRALPEGITAGRGDSAARCPDPRPATGTPPPWAWPWPPRPDHDAGPGWPRRRSSQ